MVSYRPRWRPIYGKIKNVSKVLCRYVIPEITRWLKGFKYVSNPVGKNLIGILANIIERDQTSPKIINQATKQNKKVDAKKVLKKALRVGEHLEKNST